MIPTLQLNDFGVLAVGLPRCIKAALRNRTVRPVLNDQGMHLQQVEQKIYSRLSSGSSGAILLPAGLLGVVVTMLEDLRLPYHASITDEILPYPLAPPDRENRLVKRLGGHSLIDFIMQNRLGIIRHRDTVQVADTAAVLSAAYPRARIAVLAGSHETINEITGRIRRHGIACEVSVSNRTAPDSARIVVGTAAGLAGYGVALEHRHFLLDADCLSNLSDLGKSPLRHAWRARKLGFLRSGTQLSPSEEDLLRAHFGFQELHLSGDGKRQRGVVVQWREVNGGKRLASDYGTLVDLKRTAYWRNEMVGRIVAKFANTAKESRAGLDSSAKVVVVVDNVEQTAHVAARLPTWPIFVAAHALGEGRANLPAAIANRCQRAQPATCAIATMAAVKDLAWPSVDVIIRADGGTGVLPFAADALVIPNSNPIDPLEIIDLDDRRHPQLGRWTASRKESYDRAGWFGPGGNPARKRVRLYLKDLEASR